MTIVRVTVCDWPDWGAAESPVPNIPVKVPVTLVVPLNVPVLVFKFMDTHAGELKSKKIGGTPPDVVTVNE